MRLKRLILALVVLLGLIVVVEVTLIGCEWGVQPARASAQTAPSKPERLTPLERYNPLVRYAEHELDFAISAESFVERSDSVLRSGGPDGTVIAAGSGTAKRLTLGLLGPESYGPGQPVSRQDEITFADDAAGLASRRREVDHAVYPRSLVDAEGRTHLQYWYLSHYNDSLPCWGRFGGLGDHRGDWEVAIVSLARDGTPYRVVYSQHKGAQARPWSEVEKVDGHPVLYPALGTHAGGFEPGPRLGNSLAADVNNGGGLEVLPPLRSFDERWASWPGKWGTIPAPCTRRLWHDPHALD